MTTKINTFFIFLLCLIPIFLVTGPALPDITISLSSIFFLYYIFFNQKKYILTKSNFFKISIIFWISLIFISFFAVDNLKSFQDSIIFIRFLLIPIGCYFLFFKNDIFLKYLLFVIFVTVIFVSLDTLLQFFRYTSADGFGKDIFGFKSEWDGRLTGPFKDELIPGSYVSKFGLLGFAFILVNKKLNNMFFLKSLYLSLVLLVCFSSGERMALATYSLGLVLLFLFLKGNRKAIFIAIILGLLSILTIYKIHPFYSDYKVLESNELHLGLKIEKKYPCKNDLNKECIKVVDRQPNFFKIIKNFSSSAYGEIYLLSFEMFKDRPVTGIGLNNFKSLCVNEKKYKSMMAELNCQAHPHNIYIQWITEGGMIVFTLFLIYLYFLFDLIAKNKGDKDLKIISIISVFILVWPIMSTGSLIKNWYGIIFFFIIAISMCLSRIKKDS